MFFNKLFVIKYFMILLLLIDPTCFSLNDNLMILIII